MIHKHDSLTPQSNNGRYSRLHSLQELEERLNDFFRLYPSPTKVSYSIQELGIIVRITKKLIRHLKGTPKFKLFAGKQKKRIRLEPAIEQELRYQKTDEARLRHIVITRYNPLSEKYKAIKKAKLEELGKD